MPYNVTTIRRWLYKIWFEKKINIHALRYPLGPFLIEFREDYSQIHPPKNSLPKNKQSTTSHNDYYTPQVHYPNDGD